MEFKDKVVAITGAGSGIGRALALAAAAKGASIAGLDRNLASMEETAALVKAAGGRCLAVKGDVGDAADAEAFRDASLKEFGTVDVLINNAGIIQPFVPFTKLTVEQIERVFHVNWWGVVHMTRAFLPVLQQRPAAHLVNVSSMGGFCPVPGQGVYGASKAAVKLFTESLTLELADTNVGVTLVFPGGVRTNISQNAPDVSDAEKAKTAAKAKESAYGITAEKAASTILAAVEKGRRRITVGPDSAVLDKLTRLAPVSSGKVMAALIKRAGATASD